MTEYPQSPGSFTTTLIKAEARDDEAEQFDEPTSPQNVNNSSERRLVDRHCQGDEIFCIAER
jgi:hypothetical protein